jgi:lysyl-tRNA synthetase, class II
MDNSLSAQRREKLARLHELGVDPYPPRIARTHMIADLWKNEAAFAEAAQKVTIVGRIAALRRHGKIGFANLQDETGRIQIYVRSDTVVEGDYDVFKLLDLGDFAEAAGEAFHTQTGEYSVKVDRLRILSKSLLPLPTVKEKVVDDKTVRFDEFADIELRYRKRYLDLLLNPDVKRDFEIRARMLEHIRVFLTRNGFLEVETPIMQPLYGGANARPFMTHHNTLDREMFLRIALELYLKRLIIGGFERVFEIGKIFRNEGIDRTHNPEFTMLELYQAYADYHDIMDLTENLVRETAMTVLGTGTVNYNGAEINLDQPWRRATMRDLVREYAGLADFEPGTVRAWCVARKIKLLPAWGEGKMIVEIFEHSVQPKLIQPTFVLDHPREVSPLAKAIPGDPDWVERFELFIGGDEFANAFTELNDPVDQRGRLEAQARLRDLGDVEANVVDEDFLEAMEYGMPPTGGLGIGIDRLAMLLTGSQTIRDVLLFPQMRDN